MCPRAYDSDCSADASGFTSGRPGCRCRTRSSRARITHAAPSSAGQHIIDVSGRGHHARRQHLFGRHHVVGLAVRHRRHRAVVPALRRDLGVGLDAWCRARACVAAPTARSTTRAGSARRSRRDRRRGSRRCRPSRSSCRSTAPSRRRRDPTPPPTPPPGTRPGPVADAFSMCVTGSPVSPSSFIAFTPIIDARRDVAHHRLVDVGQRHARVVQREQPGVARDVHERERHAGSRSAPSRCRRPRRPRTSARAASARAPFQRTEPVDHDVVAVTVGVAGSRGRARAPCRSRSRRDRPAGSPGCAGPPAGRPGPTP